MDRPACFCCWLESIPRGYCQRAESFPFYLPRKLSGTGILFNITSISGYIVKINLF